MKSSTITLTTLVVLAGFLFFRNNTNIVTAEIVGLPVTNNFRSEIIKPIYDSEILVHAIEKKLMH